MLSNQWRGFRTDYSTGQSTPWCCVAEDKQRFEDQLQAHPKLAAMIKAYEEKQQELRTLKRGKSKKSTKGTKKRRRQEEDQASENDEVRTHLHLPFSALPNHNLHTQPHPPDGMLLKSPPPSLGPPFLPTPPLIQQAAQAVWYLDAVGVCAADPEASAVQQLRCASCTDWYAAAEAACSFSRL